ncbi:MULTISPECIES: winged helix-turn-helix domain-containing protein [Sphingobacterium]|uniref:winged helix-turn-helix domain-containing protein n=1 Tax=Sphingobacterium TaxID=28453 RepID=UPI00257ED558|nr:MULTISPECIES: winged helix-turn-helix domain-containing protein [Sphingobacterium]
MRFDFKNLPNRKRRYIIGLTFVFLSIALIGLAFSKEGRSSFDEAKTEILLRKLGHQLLLQSGDSTSRVLPIERITVDEYRIRFEQHITFQPDSLLNTAKDLLSEDPVTRNYIVNVLNCATNAVAYGFAIAGDKEDDIVPCLGREQPSECYIVDIKFNPIEHDAKNVYILGSLSALAFICFVVFRPRALQKAPKDDQLVQVFHFGSVRFDPKEKLLRINNECIDLTRTEARLMHIFALSPNETITRSRLQKEIWEDEGVIVGRSLDMFISKLRKKLETVPDINIVVVRGKGYKLETRF